MRVSVRVSLREAEDEGKVEAVVMATRGAEYDFEGEGQGGGTGESKREDEV